MLYAYEETNGIVKLYEVNTTTGEATEIPYDEDIFQSIVFDVDNPS